MFLGGVTSCGLHILFLCPPLLLLCMLGVRSSCMGTNAANLFLYMDVAGRAGFWTNHYLFCTLCAFELVGTGMVGGGLMWFLFDCVCWSFFFLNLKQRSWDLLKGFPTSCFSVWHNLPIYPLPTPQRKQEAFPVCLWSNQLPEPKDNGEHPVFAFKTRWYWGTQIPLFSCFCGLQKQTTDLKIVSNLVQILVLGYCNLLDCRGAQRVWNYLLADVRSIGGG